ncbi:hypothetical protein O181_012935 [Austropuccinia psidii MF-1]|uniref:Uncharacterized protein n=1 Tax=Austropuccinia psidii MF-1 TaxID=1389203 RepID=A0A9Q3BYW7_9BASI|nr:hypothetical protein [Austropuccinia psidii MF-1]
MVHGALRLLWPKPNEAKRGQGGSQPAPKARWVSNHKLAHLRQFWPQSQQSQKWPKGPQDPNWPRITFWPLSIPGLWKPPEAISSGAEIFPLNSGEDLSFTNVLHTKGSRHGPYMVQYTIMHQFFSAIQW